MPLPLFHKPRTTTPVTGTHGLLFAASMMAFVVLFVGGLLAIFAADLRYIHGEPGVIAKVIRSPEIRAALWLSLWTSAVTVVLGLVFAIPMGYALSRYRFWGHAVVDSIVDLPIILPPLVVGLSLLVFFQTDLGKLIEARGLKFVFERKGIVLCQLPFLRLFLFVLRILGPTQFFPGATALTKPVFVLSILHHYGKYKKVR